MRDLLIGLLLLTGCAGRLPPPGFAEHATLHQRAEYARGAGAAMYLGRIRRHDGRVAYLKELDGHVFLLREILKAHDHTRLLEVPPRAADGYRQAIDDELLRLQEEAQQIGALVKEFLDLGVNRKLIEIVPELAEALRLSRRRPPALGVSALSEPVLLDYQHILGTGPAACGADVPDPKEAAPPPDFIVEARRYWEDPVHISVTPALKAQYARIRDASLGQRKAMGLYGVYRGIRKNGAGETWGFQVGSVGRTQGGGLDVDFRPRALLVDCDFDAAGALRAARETVVDPEGNLIRFEPDM